MKSIYKFVLYLCLLLPFVQCTKKECTDIYAPVCGADGKSYLNACLAKVAGTTALSEGICTNLATATVRFHGDQERSQCTWILEIEEEDSDVTSLWYAPELPDVLKRENQKVEVHFVPNDISFNCLFDGEEKLIIYMDLIEIKAN